MSSTRIPNEDLAHLFQSTELGRRVLESLVQQFYDQESYTKDSPSHTYYLEGQRSVFANIITRINQAKVEAIDEQQ